MTFIIPVSISGRRLLQASREVSVSEAATSQRTALAEEDEQPLAGDQGAAKTTPAASGSAGNCRPVTERSSLGGKAACASPVAQA